MRLHSSVSDSYLCTNTSVTSHVGWYFTTKPTTRHHTSSKHLLPPLVFFYLHTVESITKTLTVEKGHVSDLFLFRFSSSLQTVGIRRKFLPRLLSDLWKVEGERQKQLKDYKNKRLTFLFIISFYTQHRKKVPGVMPILSHKQVLKKLSAASGQVCDRFLAFWFDWFKCKSKCF